MASWDLSNKVAIVTGANSGFGQAIAVLFAKKGASIVLSGRDEKRLSTAVTECRDASGGHQDRFISVAGDLTKSNVRQSIVDEAISKFGKLDILVANAGGVRIHDTIDDATDEIFDSLFNLNVKSVFFLIQEAKKHLEKTGGNVVTVSSIGSAVPIGLSIVYPMSKAAIDHMTTCFSLILAPMGIRINTVNPSFCPTRVVRSMNHDKENEIEQQNDKIVDLERPFHPLRGECITADDIAHAALFLASDSARCITGQSVAVDNCRRMMTFLIKKSKT